MENNKLVSSADTCEQCHSRDRVSGTEAADHDQVQGRRGEYPDQTVLMMMVGGGSTGGIHGVHMGPGVHMRYAAADKKRQTIPWVEYQNTNTGSQANLLASDAKPDTVAAMPTFEMQCVDCHNRAAHSFELPDRAVDGAIHRARNRTGMPFVKKTAIELLKTEYKIGRGSGTENPRRLDAVLSGKISGRSSHAQ